MEPLFYVVGKFAKVVDVCSQPHKERKGPKLIQSQKQ